MLGSLDDNPTIPGMALAVALLHADSIHWGFMRTVPCKMTVFECKSMVAAARLDTSACKRYLCTRYATYR